MEASGNLTLNSGGNGSCALAPQYMTGLSLIDISTITIGQPVTARLLWVCLMKKKTKDILNCNLALFHNFLYVLCFVHLISLLLKRENPSTLLNVVLVYAQTGGPMSLAFICMERYVAVIHPTSYPLLKKHRCREVCAVMVWLCSVLTGVMTVFIGKVSDETEITLKATPFVVMAINTTLMTWCSVRIARELKKSGPGRDELHPMKRKAFVTVCTTFLINLLCYIPVSALQRSNFNKEYSFQCRVIPLCVLLLAIASVVHPLLYLSTQKKLKIWSKGKNKAP